MPARLSPAAWMLTACGTLGLLVTAGAQVLRERPAPRPAVRDTGRAVRMYEGTSTRGLFQEALDDAVKQALRALPGADRMVRYRVRDITGEQGGIRGANLLRVSIEVLDAEPAPAVRDVRPQAEPEPDEPPAPRASDLETIRRDVHPILRLSRQTVDRADTVTLTLMVQNTTAQTVRVPFTDAQRYEFEAWRDNRLVWRWSNGKLFGQALGTLTLTPGETATYRAEWNLRNMQGVRVPAGKYTLKAYLKHTDEPALQVTASAPLTITDRQ